MNSWIPHTPTVKQAAFLGLDDVREVFYGGAAGPGKSDALLMAALQYVDVPGYSALILRRTYKQLVMPGALLSRAESWLAGAEGVHWRPPTFTFPSGATVTFGHAHNPQAVRADYQSAEFQTVCTDELTDFEEETYRFMFSRLRRLEGAPVPIRMRSASNPGGRGHGWVKRRFVDPETREPGAVFISAHLQENPYVDRDEYVQTLKLTYPVTWKRLLFGDWEITEAGALFRAREWLADKFIDRDQVPEHAPAVRYWDQAASSPTPDYPDPDWTVGTLMAHDTSRKVAQIVDVCRFRADAGETERRIRAQAELDGRSVTVGIEQEPGASGKGQVAHYADDVLFGFDVRAVRPTGPKEVRARPLAGAMARGAVEIVRGRWNSDWFDEVDQFDLGEHDDQVDSASGAWELLARLPASRRQGVGARIAGMSMTRPGIPVR